MRAVAVLCPSERDRRAIAAARLAERWDVRFVGDDLDRVPSLDPAALTREAEAVAADGIAATKDLSALLAAVVARRRGLPGPDPDALVRCQLKPRSREIQREVAPDSTPRAAVLEGEPPFAPPFFVKPVVGRLSAGALRVDARADLARIPSSEAYAARWEAVAALAGVEPGTGRGLLVEELLDGLEVTVEGFVHAGRATAIGVTDSVMYPGTSSFERFEYPSSLPDERHDELAELAGRLALAHGLDDAFFNAELFVPPAGPPGIVELNARLASQFAPLVLGVHGRSTYEALFALACGDDPAWRSGRPDGVAVSYVVRVFEDALVEDVGEAADDVELLVRPGLRLSEQGVNDSASYRLAIVTGFGETRGEAVARCRDRAAGLRIRLAPPLPVRP